MSISTRKAGKKEEMKSRYKHASANHVTAAYAILTNQVMAFKNGQPTSNQRAVRLIEVAVHAARGRACTRLSHGRERSADASDVGEAAAQHLQRLQRGDTRGKSDTTLVFQTLKARLTVLRTRGRGTHEVMN